MFVWSWRGSGPEGGSLVMKREEGITEGNKQTWDRSPSRGLAVRTPCAVTGEGGADTTDAVPTKSVLSRKRARIRSKFLYFYSEASIVT